MSMPGGEHVNEIVFAGEAIAIGRWRLPATHVRFRDSGPARGYLVVFPRTGTWIQHAGGDPFVADPTIVTLYNARQEYTRRPIAAAGDWCDYYVLNPAILRHIVASMDAAAAAAPERILRFTHVPADADLYLVQRQVYRHVRAVTPPDALYVEETMIDVVARLLRRAYAHVPAVSPLQRNLVEQTRETIARRFASRLTLSDLAATVGSSMFHLCRVFRAATGTTIHAYRNQVRLRAALGRVLDSRTDLSAVALDLGYSTHSHFTAAFHACYGITPSVARRGRHRLHRAPEHITLRQQGPPSRPR